MECGRIEKVEGAGMKIIYEIPDSARGMSVCCVWQDGEKGLCIGQHIADSDDLKAGVVLVPEWKGGEADET